MTTIQLAYQLQQVDKGDHSVTFLVKVFAGAIPVKRGALRRALRDTTTTLHTQAGPIASTFTNTLTAIERPEGLRVTATVIRAADLVDAGWALLAPRTARFDRRHLTDLDGLDITIGPGVELNATPADEIPLAPPPDTRRLEALQAKARTVLATKDKR